MEGRQNGADMRRTLRRKWKDKVPEAQGLAGDFQKETAGLTGKEENAHKEGRRGGTTLKTGRQKGKRNNRCRGENEKKSIRGTNIKRVRSPTP